MLHRLLCLWFLCLPGAALPEQVDVVIYGGTSAGVVAAVQVQRMGKTACLIEPGQHLGGLTSGGLGATDIGNKQVIGGLSREFYHRVWQHYRDPAAWTFQRAEDYRSARQAADEEAQWTFEPHVAERVFEQMAREAGVRIVRGQRLDLRDGVAMQGTRISEIRMEDGRTYRADCFIDASYEGDLLAGAGVTFHVGREANEVYGETLNGVQTALAVHHQLHDGVDPYVVPGDPTSGLLPGVLPGPPAPDGTGDHLVQAYCFRMCNTDVPENRLPFEKPDGYDPLRYELLLRNFEAGETRAPWSPTPMPNRKTDTNNNYGFSTDNINMNHRWATGDYETRQRIFAEHLQYQQGLMWTLANHPRVPAALRQEFARWGNCRDEFPEHQGWSHQLYVREARRMIADQVMTQHHCQGTAVAVDAVGMAAYGMDSHHTQRYVDAQGHARNEGDVQVGGFAPYPIAYQALVPRASECTNLLVPVCLSASHIAYGSIRMEPVFMVLGQSAATAACQAIDQQVTVQEIDMPRLRQRLLSDGQVLSAPGNRLPGKVE